MYSDKVMQHFKNPKNLGRLNKPDGLGQVGNPVCGDIMVVSIKVGQDKQGEPFIKDIGFETMGCVAAIAVSSMTTEMAKGKTIAQAKKLKFSDVDLALGELPPIKKHCAQLAIRALREAIKNYELHITNDK